MDPVVLGVFGFVYLGMFLGRFPGLAIERTGIALLGAIGLIVMGRVTPRDAWGAIDVPTMGLLFGLMLVSAQLRLGGLYTAITRRIAAADASPQRLLGAVIGVAGVLSAVLANDIVCLAVAPLLVEGCSRRGLNPVPFLVGLACASNIGSAATLIGNPQNMLIGQTLAMSFAGYLLDAGVPSLLGLAACWWIIVRLTGGRWHLDMDAVEAPAPRLRLWQSGKGLIIVTALVAAFLAAPVPREVLALAAAGLILASREMDSREMLGLVDWHLLVLFVSLFVVNHALQATGVVSEAVAGLAALRIDATHPAWLFGVVAVLSNVVSNVPAVMLLLPAATHPLAGPALALASTLAGNLIIVGSIANIIVVDQAARLGVRVSWIEHARIGVPVTLLTLLIAAGWLWLRTLM